MEDPQVVLLDGAEYLTWFEFVEQIQNCPSIQVIMLDDSNRHRAQKTWMIQDALLNSPDWKRVA
jgi:hypothetical protein